MKYQTALLAVRDIRNLADGRAGAFVELQDPLALVDVSQLYMFFQWEEERWLIDEIIVGPFERAGSGESPGIAWLPGPWPRSSGCYKFVTLCLLKDLDWCELNPGVCE